MDAWRNSLDALWERLWQVLAGEDDTRHAVLATRRADGGADARLLVIRRTDPAAAELDLHTDRHSPKLAQVAAEPRVALLVWAREWQLQVRLRGRMTASGGAALWDAVPGPSRGNYGVVPPPGTPIAAPDAYSRVPRPDRLAILTLAADEIDVVTLHPDGDRRALYARDAGWRGRWLAP